MVDGVEEEGWFASDFTLAEIKTLRAIQPFPERDPAYNGKFQIPTLDEILDLAEAKGRAAQHWRLCRDQASDLSRQPGPQARRSPARHPGPLRLHQQASPVILQSFELANLQYLRGKTQLRLVQLVDANDINADGSIHLAAPFDKPYDWAVAGDARTFASLLTPAGLQEIKTYADGIGPWKPYLIPSAVAGRQPTTASRTTSTATASSTSATA